MKERIVSSTASNTECLTLVELCQFIPGEFLASIFYLGKIPSKLSVNSKLLNKDFRIKANTILLNALLCFFFFFFLQSLTTRYSKSCLHCFEYIQHDDSSSDAT